MKGRRARARVALVGAAVGLAAAVGAPCTASAVEHEHFIGVDLGGAILMVKDKSSADVGGSVGVHYTYGITDAFNLVADAGWSLVALKETLPDPTAARIRPSNVTNVDLGLAYVLDVLQWVPWGSLQIGGYALDGGTIGGVDVRPGAAISLGLDYRLNRSWSVGVTGREHLLFTDMSNYPSFLQGFIRAEYVWGW